MPDVPEPGTIVEYFMAIEETVMDTWYQSWGTFKKIENGKVYIVEAVDSEGESLLPVEKWRYPGEKEWRQ